MEKGRLKTIALINRKSGTVRTRGAEAVADLLRQKLDSHFEVFDVRLFDGDIQKELRDVIAAGSVDIVFAGGGDGTISSAAQMLKDTSIALGALPLGTMNLFVQALGFSPRLEDALDQMVKASVQSVDVGLANGRVFLHQVSFGLQPRMARLREKLGYRSRLTKMVASVRALVLLAVSPKSVRVNADVDGLPIKVTAPLLIVSNNPLYPAKRIRVQDALDTGVLGYYTLNQYSLRTLLSLCRDYLADRIQANEAVELKTAKSVIITRRPRRFPSYKKRKAILGSMDGEVVVLENPVTISIKPKSLQVLRPA